MSSRFLRYKVVKNWKYTKSPKSNLKYLLSKVPCIHLILPPSLNFHSVSLYDQPFSRYKVVENRQYTEWPQNNLKHLQCICRKYPVYTEYSPPRTKFHSVSFYDQPFSRYKVVENRKCTKWPQNDLNHLTVKSTLYTLNANPQGPNFTPFRSTTSRFRDISLPQITNAPNDPRMTLTT